MVEVKTAKDFFEKILPQRFKPEKAKGIEVIVNIAISGINGGKWIVTIKKQTLKIKEGNHDSPTISLKMSEKDYLDVINGKLSGEKAFFLGKLKLKGNISQALRLKDAGLF
jgi:3-hydroxyacyl-CoA dehydrogenase/3a,7a,12a-trihydroxy-5b-cholest-24-enoyl-CoA hydratase